MIDLIDRQAVLDLIYIPMPELERKIKALPPVEQKPGKWKVTDGILVYCSECCHVNFKATNYCPNCGAKMEGEE